MFAPANTSLDDLVEQARPVVTRVLRRRFHGVSLSPADDRRENERAIECFQQAMLALCAKFGRVLDGTDPPILSVADYAARVANNVANEEIRPPNWSRLSNRVRRVLSNDSRFDTWEDPALGAVAGYAGWRAQRQQSGSVAGLRAAAADLRSGAITATQWERLGTEEWASLLEQVFDAAGGPLPVAKVVHFLADVLETTVEVSSDDPDDDGEPAPPGRQARADDRVVVREQLRHLWACTGQLRREWRLAFLLNLPSIGEPQRDHGRDRVETRSAAATPRASGRGTGRGEIDVFPANGVASIAAIGEALALGVDEYERLLEGLAVEPAGRTQEVAPIYSLWTHLPLSDRVIGQALGKTGMQVLALRKLAIRQLAGCMKARASGHEAAARPDYGTRKV